MSKSVSWMPRMSRACAFTVAQVAMPPFFDVVGGAEAAVGGEAAIGDQLAGRMRLPVRADHIGAQEHLVRRMRRVRLVLVDERRGGVLVLVDVVGGAED